MATLVAASAWGNNGVQFSTWDGVVAAPGEDSAATGSNGDQNDNSSTIAGAVYVY